MNISGESERMINFTKNLQRVLRRLRTDEKNNTLISYKITVYLGKKETELSTSDTLMILCMKKKKLSAF